jgi:precorrin-2/cobalt-factor-2 C20-methyltransferase
VSGVTLYGVGVGPGAPDLITLRALAVLRNTPVLALPRANDYGTSMAWTIVEAALAAQGGDQVGIAGQERLFLTFPMNKDPARLRAAWEVAFAKIGDRLTRGLSVAFATEGDPSLYSSFIYLAREAPRRWPGVRVEIVPGVSSLAAVPARTGVPLADGQERIAIIPANYGVDDLARVLESFDTTVIMKIGHEMPGVVAALERTGLTDRAVYVSRATMEGERIETDVRRIAAAYGDCFAMVVVARKERSGVLAGDVPAMARGALGGAP